MALRFTTLTAGDPSRRFIGVGVGVDRHDEVAEWCEARVAEMDIAAPDLLLVESANVLRRLEILDKRDPSAIAQAFWTCDVCPSI